MGAWASIRTSVMSPGTPLVVVGAGDQVGARHRRAGRAQLADHVVEGVTHLPDVPAQPRRVWVRASLPALLEVGCGTGQASSSLAALGFSVTAVEPGAGMAALARRRLRTTRRHTSVDMLSPIDYEQAHAPPVCRARLVRDLRLRCLRSLGGADFRCESALVGRRPQRGAVGRRCLQGRTGRADAAARSAALSRGAIEATERLRPRNPRVGDPVRLTR